MTWSRAERDRAAAAYQAGGHGDAAAKAGLVHSLQILRGVAAILVLLRHAAKFAVESDAGRAFPVGQAGVDIFFVISGAVIFLTGRNLDWHVFIRRRIARIVPLYWLVTLAAIAAALLPLILDVGFRPHGGFSLWNAIASIFFIPAFDAEGGIFPPIVAGWTLNFEMYFYLLCMFVLMILPRHLFMIGVTLGILAGVAIGAPYLWTVGRDEIAYPLAIFLLPITLEFVAGLWLARAWMAGLRTPLWFNGLLIVAAVAWLAMVPDAYPYTVWRPLAWGIPAIALVWALMASEEKIDFRSWRIGNLLGDASYAIYLTHPIVLAFAEVVLRRLKWDLGFGEKIVLALAISLAAGIIAHLMVEKPLVRIASRLLGVARPAR
jgi:exopolysaccharide production protein ExoZ